MNILSLFKTRDGKIIVENFLSLSFLQVVTMILPLITLPYIIRVIGYEKFGLIALASSLVMYFQSLVDYSFKITAVRDLSLNRRYPKRVSLIYSRVMLIKFILLILALTLLSFIVYIYPPFYVEKELFFYTSLSLIGGVLFPEWFFQGIEKMRYITIINACIKVIFSLSVFVFIQESGDYLLIPFLTSSGLIVSGIVGQVYLHKNFRVGFVIIPIRSLIKAIKNNFYIFINQFVPNLYNNSTSFLLGVFAGNEALGVYSAILKIIDLCIVLLNVVSRVFFPFNNRNKSSFLVYKKIIFLLAFFGVTALLLVHDVIFFYLDLENYLALPLLIITGLSIFGYVLYDVFGLNYFIVNKNDKLVMKNTLFSSIFSFLLAFPLIASFGVIGAACTLLIGRLLMGGVLAGLYMKDKVCFGK
ncbi:oligosaccharide flippase family protein [Pseudoalteromonas sp. OF7H-1]|uniref:oligosaccharide flippase family protein n=1 Tax=Pseudoalteromonas sp. OF7H-1 TaxID=2917755 RepID=UPI001EF60E38|nr:oligosaccharide flippase family protein [Pseudoalteromonas sp. OF7H-1]MCG7538912.1 oligosaccharide flippase family protein [Pseudoalteromonas sp. OF7H-1]